MAEKEQALREVVLAKRGELFERLRQIIVFEPCSVSDEQLQRYLEDHPNIPAAELASVLRFNLELGQIKSIVTGSWERFWPFEGTGHMLPSRTREPSPTDYPLRTSAAGG